MPSILNRLDPLTVASLKEPGLYPDGGGLHLQVSRSGAKSWLYVFTLHARRHFMGLGGINSISLRKARQLRAAAAELRAQGICPLQHKRQQRASARVESARTVTFKVEAENYIKAHQPSWKNEKHGDQWRSTLAAYAFATIGDVPVGAVDTALVLKVLEPIWSKKPETASRLRGRIEKILDRSKARGLRSGDNPASWSNLKAILPSRAKVQRVQHHAALPYQQLPAFMVELRQQDGIAARALELTILCCTRTGETIGAAPGEFDLRGKLWTVPADRMKMKRTHRIPLADRAVDILRPLLDGADQFIFPGPKGKHLSNGAMLAVLERMQFGHVTTHGMRSSFRDWAAEQTAYPSEVVEAALAHANDDATEAAYLRTDFFEKRRKLMDAWVRYCNAPQGKHGDVVVPMRQGK